MKIKIEMTVDVNIEVVQQFMEDLSADESVKDFVRSWIINGGIGSMDEALFNSGYNPNACSLVKSNMKK